MIAESLDKALRAAGLPIVGVSIGRIADKKTWRMDFDGEPTEDMKAAAAKVIANFDPDTVKPPERSDPAAEIADLKQRLAKLEKAAKP